MEKEKKKIIIANAFSINMLKDDIKLVKFIKLKDLKKVKDLFKDREIINAIGHKSTMNLVNKLLGLNLEPNRIEVKLDNNEESFLLVFQVGIRLEEGRILEEKEVEELWEKGLISIWLILS